MRIIGIDPGTIVTGIGIIECFEGKLKMIDCDVILNNSKIPLSDRLKKIYDICTLKINKYSPQEFAIETAFYGKNIQSTLKIGQARGVAIISAANARLNISEYSPREIKQSVSGSGASNKEIVRNFVKKILNIKTDPKFFDSTDALAVALCHYFSLTNNIYLSKYKTSKNFNWKDFIENNPERIVK
ncbi:MAG TPA: crossover junction endodeoxyribonuclease RuvC [Ignavibacteria bacterium]|nr:crossover junction endodeoxyribonuclease RuvC [Ignavibacteria bacterium]